MNTIFLSATLQAVSLFSSENRIQTSDISNGNQKANPCISIIYTHGMFRYYYVIWRVSAMATTSQTKVQCRSGREERTLPRSWKREASLSWLIGLGNWLWFMWFSISVKRWLLLCFVPKFGSPQDINKITSGIYACLIHCMIITHPCCMMNMHFRMF